MDEQLNNEVERGQKAEKLLKDPMLIEAFETVEKQILHMFSSARIGDEKSILKAKDLEYALSLVRRALEQVFKTGQLAAHDLEQKRRGVTWLGDVWQNRRSRP